VTARKTAPAMIKRCQNDIQPFFDYSSGSSCRPANPSSSVCQ
jgi:hypothetical protein